MVSREQPKLKLSFIGDGFRHGAVPLSVLANRLQALQQAVFHAAATAAGHRGERRGQWANRYRNIAELTFVDAHHSDLVIEAALAVDPSVEKDFDLGLEAVDLLFNFAAAIENRSLPKLNLPWVEQDYLLRSIEGIMPNVGDQYSIKLENCRADKHPSVTFTPEARQIVKELLPRLEQPYFEAEEPITVVGELNTIRVNSGEDKITVRSQQRDIDCFYGDALRDQVANLVGGSIVEVSGLATLNDREQVQKIRQVTSISPLSMEPLRLARFEFGGRIYQLKDPIAVNIEHSDGLWVYHHSPLNLWGYSTRREDALRELHENFDYLFRSIAEEQDDQLEPVALRLKRKLRSLVEETKG